MSSAVTLSPKPNGAWAQPLEPEVLRMVEPPRSRSRRMGGDPLDVQFSFEPSKTKRANGNAWWVCTGEWQGQKWTSTSHPTKNEAKRDVVEQMEDYQPPPPPKPKQQPVVVYELPPPPSSTKDHLVSLYTTTPTTPFQTCRGCGVYVTCMACSACKSPICTVNPYYCSLFHFDHTTGKCKGVPQPLPSPDTSTESRSSSFDASPYPVYSPYCNQQQPLLPFPQ